MTSENGLLTIAAEFATASGNAERYAALTAHATGAQREQYEIDAAKWHEISRQRAERLRAALRRALDTTTPAAPDGEAPVSAPTRGVVEIRGAWNGGRRAVRIHYTPAQAFAVGAALIACAAITETHTGQAPVVFAFPPFPTPAPDSDTSDQGRHA